MLSLPEVHIDSDYMSDSEGAMAVMENNGKIAILVRKRLAPAIQQLIQHGLMVVGTHITTFKNTSDRHYDPLCRTVKSIPNTVNFIRCV